MATEYLNFCQYYDKEQKCPYEEGFEARAWAAEQEACKANCNDVKSFLHFIATFMGKWDPYGFRSDVARYIAEFPDYPIEGKLDIAKIYELGDYLLMQKPRGRTVFEYSWEGTMLPMTGGHYLYFDGKVYEKYGTSILEFYVLIKQDKTLVAEVKEFIQSHNEEIQKFPAKIECDHITDSAFEHLKFLSKKCSGYAMSYAEGAVNVMSIAMDIASLFRKHGCPIEGLEQEENMIEMLYGVPSDLDDEENESFL